MTMTKADLKEIARRFLEDRVVLSIGMDVESRTTSITARCWHGNDVVLWREVSVPVYQNLADAPGRWLAPFNTRPEEWSRCVDVRTHVEDVHPAMRGELGHCVCGRRAGEDIERLHFDVLGRVSRRSRGQR